MRIAMVSEHASPLAVIGDVDAGGQNVHVAALSSALARAGHEVVVYTRRDSPDLPQRVALDGYEVEHVDAGPPVEVPKDELLPYMGEFARVLERAWRRRAARRRARPLLDVRRGRAAGRRGRRTCRCVQTFHALGSVKRRHQGPHDTSPPDRVGVETRLARSVSRIVATCTDEVAELRRWARPAPASRSCPAASTSTTFSRRGRWR